MTEKRIPRRSNHALHLSRRYSQCLIASLAALAPRGSRFGSCLLRRHSGTKSVSPPSSSARRRAIRCLTAPLAALAPRGSRLASRLLPRHSGTKGVSPPPSSARRRAIRCLTASLAALALSYGSLRADHTSESDIVLLLSARERRVAPSTAAMQASTATSASPRSNHGATRMAGVRALRKGISTTMLCAVNS